MLETAYLQAAASADLTQIRSTASGSALVNTDELEVGLAAYTDIMSPDIAQPLAVVRHDSGVGGSFGPNNRGIASGWPESVKGWQIRGLFQM